MIETLIGSALFIIIAIAIYQAYGNILEVIVKNQWRSDAVSVLNNEIEVVRGMAYDDVGIQGGYPSGKLLAQKTVSMDNNTFTVNTTVRSVDDPFDGTLGGYPNDTTPADYKIVELEAICNSCAGFGKVTIDTTVTPKGLENTTNNGALFVNVFDANGSPVSDANVRVVNNSLNPAITINDRTNNSGVLQLVDIPTSTMAYQVTVTKAGFSSDQTYALGDVSNPNPVKPNATVATQQITSISFAIDKLSSMNTVTQNQYCSPIPNVTFGLSGTKLIGTNPDVLKYSQLFTSDSGGLQPISSLEWDTYTVNNSDANYDISGLIPLSPITILPGTSNNLSMIMVSKKPSALLVTVQDDAGNPINDASVQLISGGFNQTLLTSRRQYSQKNWAGGNYYSQSGNVDTESVPNQIELGKIGSDYATSSEWLVSNTVDFGTQNTNFSDIEWSPTNQPAGTNLSFQIATNNDNTTWNFFGPDGTANSSYNTSGSAINPLHNGNRYLRYKVFLNTSDPAITPALNSVAINFSSDCTPSGQAFFNGLNTGIYTLNVSKSGYQSFSNTNVPISSDWQEYKVKLLK